MTFMRHLSTSAPILALIVLGAACGGTGGTDGDDSVADAGGGGSETGGSENGSGGDASGGSDGSGGAASQCLIDTNAPSGSSTVVWDDGEIAAGLTTTFGNEGMLEPATLTVPVGERFGIENPAGADLRVVKVGCASGQTMSAGVTGGFIIDAPGTYAIFDEAANDLVGAKVGSVIVE